MLLRDVAQFQTGTRPFAGYLPPAAYEAVYDQQAEVMALT